MGSLTRSFLIVLYLSVPPFKCKVFCVYMDFLVFCSVDLSCSLLQPTHIISKQVFYTFVSFFFFCKILLILLLTSCFSFISSCYCHIRLLRGISSGRARRMFWLSCYPVCQFDLLSQLSPLARLKLLIFLFRLDVVAVNLTFIASLPFIFLP